MIWSFFLNFLKSFFFGKEILSFSFVVSIPLWCFWTHQPSSIELIFSFLKRRLHDSCIIWWMRVIEIMISCTWKVDYSSLLTFSILLLLLFLIYACDRKSLWVMEICFESSCLKHQTFCSLQKIFLCEHFLGSSKWNRSKFWLKHHEFLHLQFEIKNSPF